MSKAVDIIIPCYNPISQWEKIIYNNYQELKQKSPDYSFQIILVNDGSDKEILSKNITFLKEKTNAFMFFSYSKNQGKGYAIRHGLKKSNAQIAVFTDVDFPYEIDGLKDMIRTIENGADIVIGIRESIYYDKIPRFRKILSKLFRNVIKILFRIPTTDTQSGLKAFSVKGKGIALSTKINRYLFDLELIKRASQQEDIVIKEEEVTLKDNVELSSLSLRILVTEFINLFRILWI